MSGGALLGLFALVVLVCAVAAVALPMFAAKAVRNSTADRSIALPVADLDHPLPRTCARTGEMATEYVQERSGRLNPAAIFLAILGPIGLLVLAAIWFVAKRRSLVVEVPFAAAAARTRRVALANASRAAWLAAALPVAMVAFIEVSGVGDALYPLAVVLCLLAVGVAVVFAHRARFARVRVRRDSEGDLVFLDGVHPSFVAAVQAAAPAAGEPMA